MKTKTTKPRKTRAHLVLFAANTPFKPKTVERRDLYQRQPKHRLRSAD